MLSGINLIIIRIATNSLKVSFTETPLINIVPDTLTNNRRRN